MTQPDPPRSTLKNWLIFAGVAGVLLVAIVIRPIGGGGASHPAIGQRLENLNFDPLTENSQRVSTADLDGKVVMINFWGTWCKPCREEFPHIMALAKKHRGRPDFKLLAVSCGYNDPGGVSPEELREATQDFLNSRESDLPAYADLDAETRMNVFRAIGANEVTYPTTIVLDRTRTLRGLWEGYRPGTEREVEALVEKLLAEK